MLCALYFLFGAIWSMADVNRERGRLQIHPARISSAAERSGASGTLQSRATMRAVEMQRPTKMEAICSAARVTSVSRLIQSMWKLKVIAVESRNDWQRWPKRARVSNVTGTLHLWGSTGCWLKFSTWNESRVLGQVPGCRTGRLFSIEMTGIGGKKPKNTATVQSYISYLNYSKTITI